MISSFDGSLDCWMTGADGAAGGAMTVEGPEGVDAIFLTSASMDEMSESVRDVCAGSWGSLVARRMRRSLRFKSFRFCGIYEW